MQSTKLLYTENINFINEVYPAPVSKEDILFNLGRSLDVPFISPLRSILIFVIYAVLSPVMLVGFISIIINYTHLLAILGGLWGIVISIQGFRMSYKLWKNFTEVRRIYTYYMSLISKRQFITGEITSVHHVFGENRVVLTTTNYGYHFINPEGESINSNYISSVDADIYVGDQVWILFLSDKLSVIL